MVSENRPLLFLLTSIEKERRRGDFNVDDKCTFEIEGTDVIRWEGTGQLKDNGGRNENAFFASFCRGL